MKRIILILTAVFVITSCSSKTDEDIKQQIIEIKAIRYTVIDHTGTKYEHLKFERNNTASSCYITEDGKHIMFWGSFTRIEE